MSLALELQQEERIRVPVDRALELSRSIWVGLVRARRVLDCHPRPEAKVFKVDGWWFAHIEFEDPSLCDLVLKLEADPCRP